MNVDNEEAKEDKLEAESRGTLPNNFWHTLTLSPIVKDKVKAKPKAVKAKKGKKRQQKEEQIKKELEGMKMTKA